jgi:hypothetical protein
MFAIVLCTPSYLSVAGPRLFIDPQVPRPSPGNQSSAQLADAMETCDVVDEHLSKGKFEQLVAICRESAAAVQAPGRFSFSRDYGMEQRSCGPESSARASAT